MFNSDSLSTATEAVLHATPVPAEPAISCRVASLPDRSLYYRCKRAMDIVLASVLLVLLIPVLGLIALAIKLDSPGPVIYRQTRVAGRRRRRSGNAEWETRLFSAYKFRSMHFGADESAHRAYIQSYCASRAGSQTVTDTFKLQSDARVTRAGRILRRSSLDELPQLWNVLAGHMSMVGPRPVPPYEVAHYQREHYERFAAPSGLTGLWQVKGRGRVPFEEMVRMDTEYARSACLWLDVQLLYLTLPAVISGRGAC